MAQDERSRLRHAIRGNINALKLGIAALELGLTRAETLEFLEYLEQAAGKMDGQVEEYGRLPEIEVDPDQIAAPTEPFPTSWGTAAPADLSVTPLAPPN